MRPAGRQPECVSLCRDLLLLQVLSTRVYRGAPPADGGSPAGAACSGVFLAALGGAAVLESGEAWELRSCWAEDEPEGGAAA